MAEDIFSAVKDGNFDTVKKLVEIDRIDVNSTSNSLIGIVVEYLLMKHELMRL